MVNEFIATPPHNTQCDEGHQYTHSARDRGRVFNFSGQDDGLGAVGVGGRANVWDCRKLEGVIMKVMVMARGGSGDESRYYWDGEVSVIEIKWYMYSVCT